MAVAYDSSNSGETSFSLTSTISLTVPSLSNAALVACHGTREANDITGVTYNSDALAVGKLQENDNVCGAYIWYMVNPDVGTANLVSTADEFNLWDVWVGVFSGVDQSTPIANTGGTNTFSDAPSTTISTGVASGDMAVDCGHTQNSRTWTVDGSQTERYNHDHTNASQGNTVVSTELLSGTSITMSWGLSSGDNWAQAVVVLKAAAAATPISLVFNSRRRSNTLLRR